MNVPTKMVIDSGYWIIEWFMMRMQTFDYPLGGI